MHSLLNLHSDCYRIKKSKERENKKALSEIDKVVSKISQDFTGVISNEWADMIYKLSSQKKKKKVKKKSKSRSKGSSESGFRSKRDTNEVDPRIIFKTFKPSPKDFKNISDEENEASYLSKNTRRDRRRAQVFRTSDRSSVKSKWGELENLQQNRSREASVKDSEKSEFTNSQVGIESSLRDTMDKKDKSMEQQDDESVKALLTGYEDLTSDINRYFKDPRGATNEIFEDSLLDKLNETNTR